MSEDLQKILERSSNGDWAKYSFFVLNQLKAINTRLIAIEEALVELKTEFAVFKSNWKTLNIAWGTIVTILATAAGIAASIILKG